MNAQGLITTSALNTDAQAALALSSDNAEQIQTLQETSLQRLEGDYRGTIGAGLILRDADENTVLYVNGASGDVSALGVIAGSGFANTNSSFQVNDIGNCTVNELTYTTLNPPIPPGTTPSLGDVMDVNNQATQALDMTNREIQHCGIFTFNDGIGSMVGDGNIGISFEESEINNFVGF
jgi:hypothetical protein